MTPDLDRLRALLRHIIVDQMAQDPAHDLAHIDRVWANALRIALAEGDTDLRVLLGAAYLHDLVNLPKDDPNRKAASRMSADAARPILDALEFTPREILATQHAITAHSFSAQIAPESTEAEILRDAYRLDALGAIGIARNFSVSGTLGRALYDPSDPFSAGRALDDTRFSIDHWHIKLLDLPNGMITAKGREIAMKRARLMLDFLEQLAREIDTPLPNHWRDMIE